MLYALLALLGLGGAAIALGGPKDPTPGKLAQTFTKAKWYRLTLQASRAPSTDDTSNLKGALQAQGFYAAAIIPAAADNSVAAIGHFEGVTGSVLAPIPPFTLTVAEEVTPPSQDAQSALTHPLLDSNIPLPTAQAVEIALGQEKDPAVMSRFAASLLPDFPAASALLKSKAALLSLMQAAAKGQPPASSAPQPAISGYAPALDIGADPPVGSPAWAAQMAAKMRAATQSSASPAQQAALQRAQAASAQTNWNAAEVARTHYRPTGQGRENLPIGAQLWAGDPDGKLWSASNEYVAYLPPDANLAIDRAGREQMWRLATSNKARGFKPVPGFQGYLQLQPDGNLQIKYADGRVLWESGVHKDPANIKLEGLFLQGDGNLVLYDAGGYGSAVHWAAADTGFGTPLLTKYLGVDPQAARQIDNATSDTGDVVKTAAEFAVDMVKTITFEKTAEAFASNLADCVLNGRNLGDALLASGDAALSNVKAVAPLVEGVISVVPGIGSSLASGIALGCALAEGKNITEAGIDAAMAALPGGAITGDLAKRAFALAKSAVVDIANGKSLSQIGGDALRSQLPPGAAQTAFDGAFALAQGKSLQDVGFNAAKDLISGNAGDQAKEFLGKLPGVANIVSLGSSAVEQAGALAKKGAAIASDLEGKLKAELDQLPNASALVHQTVGALVGDPRKAALTSSQIATMLGVPEPIARAAKASAVVAKVPPLADLLRQMPAGTSPAMAKAAYDALSSAVAIKTARLERLLAPPKPAGPSIVHVKKITSLRGVASHVKKITSLRGVASHVPPPKPVPRSAVTYAAKRGAAATAADVAALRAQGTGKAAGKADELARAALLLERAQHVARYLALGQTLKAVA